MAGVLGRIAVLAVLGVASAAHGDSPTRAEQSVGNRSKHAVAAVEQPQPVRRTVTARVIRPSGAAGGIEAQQEPGEFTVPQGHSATGFVYSFVDPKSGRSLDRITASTIYSVTEKRYIREAEGNGRVVLKPGKYKFVVGGGPGAMGTLSYRLGPATPGEAITVETNDDGPVADVPRDGKLLVLLWVADGAEYKFHWEFDINGGVVTGRGTLPNSPSAHVENYRAEYRFEGKVRGGQISGTATQRLSWESNSGQGNVMKHRYDGQGKMELALRGDGSVTGVEVHSGITNGTPSVQDRKIDWVGSWQMSAESAAEPSKQTAP